MCDRGTSDSYVQLVRTHVVRVIFLFFFFNDTATTEIYTLSLHDALPICITWEETSLVVPWSIRWRFMLDRKSTRLNSSHLVISYAVFCLKKKKNKTHQPYVGIQRATLGAVRYYA